MLTTLAFRHLLVRPLRSLFLLLGFALGVGVMIVLLSVGEAMLDQSRDVSLVGGGEVTVLPQGTGTPVQWNQHLDDPANADFAFIDRILDSLGRELCLDEAQGSWTLTRVLD